MPYDEYPQFAGYGTKAMICIIEDARLSRTDQEIALGAIGTGLSVLNGGLGNLLGGIGGGMYSADNAAVNRYELGLVNGIASRDAEIGLLKADKYTDEKLLDLTNQVYADFRRVGDRLDSIEDKFNKADKESAVFAATATATMSCMQQSIAQLQSLTKLVVRTPPSARAGAT